MACDITCDNGWKGLSPNDKRVQALSELLQHLPIHPLEVRGPKFRNPNGVGRKTYDIATHHPNYTGVPTNAGTTDIAVLQDLLAREEEMREVARLIRDGMSSGDLVDATEAVGDVDELGGVEATERTATGATPLRPRARPLAAVKEVQQTP